MTHPTWPTQVRIVARLLLFTSINCSAAHADSSHITGVFGTDACERAPDPRPQKAEDAYRRGVLSIQDNTTGEADALLQCSIELGGPDYMGIVASYLSERDDPRAKTLTAAAAAMGVPDAQVRLGTQMMERATTREERLVAFAQFRSAAMQCMPLALERMYIVAQSSRESALIVEAAAWLSNEAARMPPGDSGFAYYSTQLKSLQRLMNPTEIETSNRRSRQIRSLVATCEAARTRTRTDASDRPSGTMQDSDSIAGFPQACEDTVQRPLASLLSLCAIRISSRQPAGPAAGDCLQGCGHRVEAERPSGR